MNTDNPVPPLLNQPQPNSGKIGLGLSLVAPVTIALMTLLHPG
jgi:hypothetical protein